MRNLTAWVSAYFMKNKMSVPVKSWCLSLLNLSTTGYFFLNTKKWRIKIKGKILAKKLFKTILKRLLFPSLLILNCNWSIKCTHTWKMKFWSIILSFFYWFLNIYRFRIMFWTYIYSQKNCRLECIIYFTNFQTLFYICAQRCLKIGLTIFIKFGMILYRNQHLSDKIS